MLNTNKTTFHISREAFLGNFLKKCRELSNNGSTSIVMGENTVTVYKDEEYNELFDVFLSQKGKNNEENDHCGVHLDALEDLIGKLLIQGYQTEKERIETNTVFGKLFAEVNGDSDYPGISICMEIKDEEQDAVLEKQFALMECTPDIPEVGGHSLRLLVWNNDHDDFTDDFTFLEDIPDGETTKKVIWEKYQHYLLDWTKSHSGSEFYGMTPASFDEWLENEYKN
jgi:hypothetical protein